MNISSNMTPWEVYNHGHAETEREQILFEKLKELLDEVSDLEDSLGVEAE